MCWSHCCTFTLIEVRLLTIYLARDHKAQATYKAQPAMSPWRCSQSHVWLLSECQPTGPSLLFIPYTSPYTSSRTTEPAAGYVRAYVFWASIVPQTSAPFPFPVYNACWSSEPRNWPPPVVLTTDQSMCWIAEPITASMHVGSIKEIRRVVMPSCLHIMESH